MPFDAFISYSHAADDALAPALRQALQNLARPWYRRRALTVFLDQANLSAAEDLPASIQRALADSRYFIYLASREAAGSAWVSRELTEWRASHGGTANRLLIALTDGDLCWREELGDFDPAHSSALHPALSRAFAQEPLWVDLRWAHTQDQVSLHDPRFLQAAAMLAAPLHGLELDELLGEDVLAHQRRRRIVAATVSGLGTLLLLVAATAWLAGRTAIDLERRQQTLEMVLPFFAGPETGQEPRTAWQSLQGALVRSLPWRRPTETDVVWHEQPSFLVVQDDCTPNQLAPEDLMPKTCAPAGTAYSAEGLRADMPLLPALAMQLLADLENGRIAKFLNAPLREGEAAVRADAEGIAAKVALVDDVADILIPPALRNKGSSPPRDRTTQWEARRSLSLLRYPLQANGMVAELLLLNFSDHRMCGAGQCISPTLVYLRRDDNLQLIWLDMAGSRLTLLDRSPGEMPDILSTEVRQSGVGWQRRLIARYEFLGGGQGMSYQAHMDGEIRASMPVNKALIPVLSVRSR